MCVGVFPHCTLSNDLLAVNWKGNGVLYGLKSRLYQTQRLHVTDLVSPRHQMAIEQTHKGTLITVRVGCALHSGNFGLLRRTQKAELHLLLGKTAFVLKAKYP